MLADLGKEDTLPFKYVLADSIYGESPEFIAAVESMPDITPPTIQVSANFPGADAGTVEQSVAAPIEEQVNGAEGMVEVGAHAPHDDSFYGVSDMAGNIWEWTTTLWGPARRERSWRSTRSRQETLDRTTSS